MYYWKNILDYKIFLRKSSLFFFLLLYVFILYFFNISCPFYTIIGLHCPTCGMTRAFIVLYDLDFVTSFYYHPLLLLTISFFIIVYLKDIGFLNNVNESIFQSFVYFNVIIILIVYLIRLYLNLLP